MINNDSDTLTSVKITDIFLSPGEGTPIPSIAPQTTVKSNQVIDLDSLEDVSGSLKALYEQTSFNDLTKILSVNLKVQNTGTYWVDAPLIVAIDRISDPTVQVKDASGITPDGLPYYELSHLIANGKLSPGTVTSSQTISFSNPSEKQFTYQLVFRGKFNANPVITSDPDVEALIGKSYVYQVSAIDPEGDTLTYSLLSSPPGMIINPDTGLITWTFNSDAVGNWNITVQVDDNRGGFVGHNYHLSVIEAPPNRPPVFTSTPVVDALINTPYRYQVVTTDADGDELTYSLVNAPQGMTVDARTGSIEWTPLSNQLGTESVSVRVTDSRGDSATQNYQIGIRPEKGNYAPVIISTPITEVYQMSSSYQYAYEVEAIDPNDDELTYTLLDKPVGMTIEATSGLITWQPTLQNLGQHQVLVQVSDRRGGVDTQSFTIDVKNTSAGVIRGTVWDDLNGNGFRDTELIQGDNPGIVFVIDISGSTTEQFSGSSVGDVNRDGRTK